MATLTGTEIGTVPGLPENFNIHDPFATGVTITVEFEFSGGVGELTSTTRVPPCVQLSLSVGVDVSPAGRMIVRRERSTLSRAADLLAVQPPRSRRARFAQGQ